jgi:hypothetical protein
MSMPLRRLTQALGDLFNMPDLPGIFPDYNAQASAIFAVSGNTAGAVMIVQLVT